MCLSDLETKLQRQTVSLYLFSVKKILNEHVAGAPGQSGPCYE